MDQPGIEIERVHSQSDALAPAQAGAARERDQRRVPEGNRGEQLPNERLTRDRPLIGVFPSMPRHGHAIARVVPDDPIPNRRPKHRREQTMTLAHGRRRSASRQLGDPRLDR
jgi:hypothetical protein